MTNKELIEAAKQAMQDMFAFNSPFMEHEQSAYNCLRLLSERLKGPDGQATYPPIVKVVLAHLQNLDEQNVGAAYNYATLDHDQDLRLSVNLPYFIDGDWQVDGSRTYIHLRGCSFDFNTKDILFQRTANGWEWVGNPENQNTNEQEKKG